MASSRIIALSDVDAQLTLAPERFVAAQLLSSTGTPLAELVRERNERIDPRALEDAAVLDTTHVRDGLIDVQAVVRMVDAPASMKKRARSGDLLVSRLRPYLRQIALIHPKAIALLDDRRIACSPEFYVLEPLEANGDLSFLLPFLLSHDVQAFLGAAQEGGHHPRVPREALFAIRVPASVMRARDVTKRRVQNALDEVYEATRTFARAMQSTGSYREKPSSPRKRASGAARSSRS